MEAEEDGRARAGTPAAAAAAEEAGAAESDMRAGTREEGKRVRCELGRCLLHNFLKSLLGLKRDE